MSTVTASSARPVGRRAGRGNVVQPVWVRVTHWLNALGAILMVMSGWRIYNASPLFSFRFPDSITLGGWLGGALQWHFAAMWLLGVNGLVYVLLNILTGRARRRFWPLSPRQLVSDFGAALRGHLSHDNPAYYNAVQKAAYVGAVALLVLMVLSAHAAGRIRNGAADPLPGDERTGVLLHRSCRDGRAGAADAEDDDLGPLIGGHRKGLRDDATASTAA